MWMTRFDYRTAGDVRTAIARIAALGCNRVLFQVRGNASTFYRSKLEPWSHLLGGADPGFDPLQVAIDAAREHRVAIEAWINVMPLWRGPTPPADPTHPFHLFPEWRVVGSDGKPQALNEHYVCGNPALPSFRRHVAAVAAEIAARYAVDAVHLDYIRYVTDLSELDYSRDPVSLARFGGDPDSDPDGWLDFKAARVTETLAGIRAAVRGARSGCRLTAAIYPTKASRRKVAQDVETWVASGLVDALYPMTYAADGQVFAERLDETLSLGTERVPVFPGVAVFRHDDVEQTREQLRTVRRRGAGGFALFCLASVHPTRDDGSLGTPSPELRATRRTLLREILTANADHKPER